MRYLIRLSYLGTSYHGWQKQLHEISVQSQVNLALKTALQETVDVVGAGRTDTGVHASGYVAHFDSSQKILDFKMLVFKLNSILPQDIAVQSVVGVKDDFHARFDAISRTYRYSIIQTKDPFSVGRSYLVKNELNLQIMQNASNLLFNHKNFKSFSKVKTDVYTFDCQIEKVEWQKEAHHLFFEITANRFLRNMVRAIVGTLIEVGLGKISVEEFNDIILAKDRSKAGKSVPAHALVLTNIKYPV
ncbi:tRNA pseudouridine(38-40) synthase TruA [Psychroflexus sp. MES1-P1E]|uniref:tRNA pseudouridine(38-40) synthase TruA n=1 Tax=Psychroflexus sp. MES1-P1E TaxID=2058320 RepID=UPI000C7C1E62|nr:tRNA pseudouridine(38-40) synthase TruA [Psychroflexus sp. MES1-P1E]PKG42924.1 tRNA pseudouridine(38-40) synthase TruA [Psychroflexus sp. MES1-P1E]